MCDECLCEDCDYENCLCAKYDNKKSCKNAGCSINEDEELRDS